MNAITPWNFENHQVRSITDDTGEPWFVGKDVCDALDLCNSRQALSRLPNDEKNTVRIEDGIRGNPNTTVINEPGVYRLIMTSRVPAAERFKHWLFHEVLPAIRKTGKYEIPESDPLSSFDRADVRTLIAMVSECRSTLGRPAAQRLWRKLPLPQPEDGAPAPASEGVSCGEAAYSAAARECLAHLLAWRPERQGPTYREALADPLANRRWLREHGIFVNPPGGEGFAIARRHADTLRAFSRTKWIDTWAKSLLRHPDAVNFPDPLWFHGGSGCRSRAVLFPWTILEERT